MLQKIHKMVFKMMINKKYKVIKNIQCKVQYGTILILSDVNKLTEKIMYFTQTVPLFTDYCIALQ